MARITAADINRARRRWSKAFKANNPAATGKKPAAAAPSAARPGKTGQPARKSPLEAKFEVLWIKEGGPPLTPEYKFHPTRKWRLDYALPDYLIAIEIEGLCRGGKGRHQQIGGFTSDCIKYFSATMLGWTVFRLPPKMISNETIKQIINHWRSRVGVGGGLVAPKDDWAQRVG